MTFLEFLIKKLQKDDTLGILRKDMPQITKKNYNHFLSWLRKRNISFRNITVNPASLKSSQAEFSDVGIEAKIDDISNNNNKFPPLISKNYYIIDGHHRWLAALNTKSVLYVTQIDVNAKKLLALIIDEYPRTKFKNIDNKRIKK